jgi:phosphatidylserine decarboxylase
MKIAREGYWFIFTAALLALLAFAAGWKWLGLTLGLLTFAFVGFFRDPERVPPAGEGLILSPADGKVVGVRRVDRGGFFGEARTRISIFLSALDVHVNRAPVKGKVEEVMYQKGRFFAAYKDKASENNERNALSIVDLKGRRLGVVQIAGVVARRIVCRVRRGDSLEPGQRFGLIMFGSRVDLYLPGGSQVEVVEGQKVRGGETIVARMV